MSESESYVTYNVNHEVRVRLTKRGLQILRSNHDRLNESCGGLLGAWKAPSTDEDGWSKFQMWEIMHELGKSCSMGMELPFETAVRIPLAALQHTPEPVAWPSREEVAEAIGSAPDIRSMTDRVLALFSIEGGSTPKEPT